VVSVIDMLACLMHWYIAEKAIGFDTAVNTITDALHKLSFTAASHDRVMVVEVMGRDAGHLALHAGLANGVDVILLPEIPFKISHVLQRVRRGKEILNRQFAMIVVAEGARSQTYSNLPCFDAAGHTHVRGVGQYIADELVSASNNELDVRVVVLGHIQRGGIPSAFDRMLATMFGAFAVDALARNERDVMVALQAARIVTVPLADVVEAGAVGVALDSQLLTAAQMVGIYVGDFDALAHSITPAPTLATTATRGGGHDQHDDTSSTTTIAHS
jgi:ATP-dependent phosphofructokinase / diphosphate-dependent phosphofructokinase